MELLGKIPDKKTHNIVQEALRGGLTSSIFTDTGIENVAEVSLLTSTFSDPVTQVEAEAFRDEINAVLTQINIALSSYKQVGVNINGVKDPYNRTSTSR